MKKAIILLLKFTVLHSYKFAGYASLDIKKGSLLVYSVKQGNKSFLYTITIKEWVEETMSFSWQTNEKSQLRKGTTILNKYYSSSSDEFLAGVGNSVNETLKESQTRILAPSSLNDFLMDESDYIKFTVNENGKITTFKSDVIRIRDYQEKPVKYNGVNVTGKYAQIFSSDERMELGFLKEGSDYKYFLTYYRSDALIMDLLSIKNGITGNNESNTSKLSLPQLEKKNGPLKMDATKLAAVKKVYPLLATVETYDVTNGGKDPKPFSET